jgi:beta-glucosidase
VKHSFHTFFLGCIFILIAERGYVQALAAFRNEKLSQQERISDLLKRLTVEEKVGLLIASAESIPRLNIEKYYHGNEALHGVVRPGNFTVFPQAIGLASTWNAPLMHQVATAISDEARARWNQFEGGNNQLLKFNDLLTFWSPVVNMARDPRWGRTQESYGEDPFLSGVLGVQFVKGLQGNNPRYLKTVATPKHFAVYNQETNRFANNAIVPIRMLREYYLPAFEACIVEGKAASIMTSYNAVNGIPAGANHFLITDVLRKDWGFQGYVVSDCGGPNHLLDAHHFVNSKGAAAIASIKAGLDLECGDDIYKEPLLHAVKTGQLKMAEIDTAVYRVLRARMQLGLFDDPANNPYNKISPETIGSTAHQALALQAARESIVLLKNENHFLPLNQKKIKSIAVVGINANNTEFGSYSGNPARTAVSILQGIRAKVDKNVQVIHMPWKAVNGLEAYELIGKDFFPGGLKADYFTNMELQGDAKSRMEENIDLDPANHPPDAFIPGTPLSVRWTGIIRTALTGNYSLGYWAHDGARLYINGKKIIDSWRRKFLQTTTADYFFEAGKEYKIRVEYFSYRRESAAKLFWKSPESKQGIKDLFKDASSAAQSADVVVAVLGINKNFDQEGGDREDIKLSIDQEIFIQEIFKANPMTVVVLEVGNSMSIDWMNKNIPAIVNAWYPGEQGGNAVADVLFGDYNPAGRLPITYYNNISELPAMNDYDISKGRTYQYFKGKPLYTFGYGLSYTRFEYSNFSVKQTDSSLHVGFILKNAGDYNGDEVAQVYMKLPERNILLPVKELKGFKRLNLKKGEVQNVKIEIDKLKLRYWDETTASFVYPKGEYEVMVGASSEDIRVRKKVIIK